MANVGTSIRVILLASIAVTLQIVVVSQLTVFGVSPDLLPLTIAAVGMLGGEMVGAVVGFIVGLLLDLALLQTLGVSSLVYLSTGYLAARFSELRKKQNALLIMVVGGLATAAATLSFIVIQFLLDIHVNFDIRMIRELLTTVLINTLLAIPVYFIVGKVLGEKLLANRRRLVALTQHSDQASALVKK